MTTLRAWVLFLSLSIPCSAEIIQGYVLNRTTGKPVADQRVVLLTTSGEQSHDSTSGKGRFHLELAGKLNSDLPEVVSTIFQGVQYFQTVVSGQEINLSVYDASNQVAGISGYLSILQFQIKGDKLQITELHALNNASNPPITKVNPGNLVLSIPDGAQIQPAIVAGPERGTLTLPLIPVKGGSNRYRIDFPLKPGMTKYAITYEIPYDNKFVFRRESQYAMKRVGVVVPDSMRFHSLDTKSFQSIRDQSGRHELILDGLQAREVVSFEISGEGKLAEAFSPSSSRQIAPNDVQAEVQSLINAHWPGSATLPKAPASPQKRSDVAVATLLIGSGIVSFAAMLVWGLIRRKSLGV
jgi:hypothetical protein